MKRSRLAPGSTWRTSVVPISLSGRDYRLAHQACHRSALLWNCIVQGLHEFWDTYKTDPTVGELRSVMYEADESLLQGLHAHTKQAIVDDVLDAVATYRENKREGRDANPPHHTKKYRPVEFTSGYGWRISTPKGSLTQRLMLSFGKGAPRISVPVPMVVDPQTACEVTPDQWGTIRMCWDTNARQWNLHISVPAPKPAALDPNKTVAIDEGIINPMTLAVETEDSYEITVINGRHARALKHQRNTTVASIASAQSKCQKHSRRWKRLDKARKRAQAKAEAGLANIDHQVTRKAADVAITHDTGNIVVGDVRGIEHKTRQAEKRRAGKNQRRRLSQWSRGKQEKHLTHKTNTTLKHINEAYSSKTCPACLTRNPPRGRNYQCRGCGFTCHRDAVGALNILMRAQHGKYTPIDANKTIHIKYLRATPLTPKKAKDKTRSNAQNRATPKHGGENQPLPLHNHANQNVEVAAA